jgi:hypothetical protein
MKSLRKLLILGILAAMLMALPVSVFAGKKIYKAHLNPENVVNSVQLSSPRGVGILGLSPGGVNFQISGNYLPVSSANAASLSASGGGDIAVHIHGPATAGQNAPVVVAICGDANAVMASCDVSKDGTLKIMGTINKPLIGMSPQDFLAALDNGTLYIQVTSDGTPIIRGQLYAN